MPKTKKPTTSAPTKPKPSSTTSKKVVEIKEDSPVDVSKDAIYDDEVWAVINELMATIGFDGSQIRSYDWFIHSLAEIIDPIKRVEIKKKGEDKIAYLIEFSSIFAQAPVIIETNGETKPLFPMEAMWRNASYMSAIYIDVSITSPNGATTNREKVYIGSVPVMVRSEICNVSPIKNDREGLCKRCEDPYDVGGYFITASKNGEACAQRRVITPQEGPALNRVFVHIGPHKTKKYPLYAEVRSTNPAANRKTTFIAGVNDKRVVSTLIPWIECEVPLGVLFCAFGVTDHAIMARYILGPEYANPKNDQDRLALEIVTRTLEASYECDTQEAALHFIGRRGRKFMKGDDAGVDAEDTIELDVHDADGDEDADDGGGGDDAGDDAAVDAEDDEKKRMSEAISYATHLLTMELFPHIVIPIGTTSSKKRPETSLFNEKATYLGYTINKLIQVAIGRRKPENRDHYGNKRVSHTGYLLAQQFYGAFRRMITEVATNTRKALAAGNTVNILSWIKPSIITNAMTGAISANNWSFGGAAAKGISQVYEQFTYAACVANLRKLRATMNADGSKVIAPRDLNPSQWMIVCPAETPEGKTAGLAKNQALGCIITIGSNPAPIRAMVEACIGDRATKHHPASLGWTKIFLNGVPIGNTDRPATLVRSLIKERRRDNLHSETSIAYLPKQNEIQISSESGRLCSPVFVVEEGKILVTPSDIAALVAGEMTWRELLASGKIELLDKTEEENAIVTLYPSDLEKRANALAVTHCELHPSMMYGVGASLIQRASHSQSPRITYHSSMNKQAVGMPFTNYRNQMCGSFHTLESPQIQLSATRATTILNADILPCYQNVMAAVMPREHNEEDSVEVNLDSVQRGLFVSYKWVAYYGEIKPEKHESFGIPTPENCEKYYGNPMFLTEEGFARRGSTVRKGDILIGKMVENMSSHDATSTSKRYTNASVVYDHTWPAVVDAIQIGTTGEGYRYIRVMTCQRREPIVGDKLATMPSQKGTISQLVRAVDLPFNKDGIVPDLVINALAFPSRMTIGTLIETLTGKVVTSTSSLHKTTLATFGLGSKDDDSEEDTKPNKKERYASERSDQFQKMFAHPKQKGCVDSTPFRPFDLSVVRAEMSKYGCDCGDEYMTDGTTGRQLRAMIFFGPISYQRLKHQSVDKLHARAKGGKTTLTRQPPDGRALGGGLRLGEHTRQSGCQKRLFSQGNKLQRSC